MKIIKTGFVSNIRILPNVIFIILRLESNIIQCVIESANAHFNIAKHLKLETIVQVTGKMQITNSKEEILVELIEVISEPMENLPIQINEKNETQELNTRFNYRWLDLRKPENHKIFRVWTLLERGFREFLYKNNFTQIYTPSFMSSASESGAEVFEVKYFERKAYLAQSPQFFKQMAIASGFEKIFIAGPVFRAENSNSTRHMTEFTGLDLEVANIKNHYELMSLEWEMLKEGLSYVVKEVEFKIEIPQDPVYLEFTEAKKILSNLGYKSNIEEDLSSEEELVLGEYAKKEFKSDLIFIVNYPVTVRPFYHMRTEEGLFTKSADLLFKGLEITTLAQREHRFEILSKQAVEKGMNVQSLENYLNFFKHSCPPHGGMGLGMNRIVKQILNLENVKEATFLPRDVKRLTP